MRSRWFWGKALELNRLVMLSQAGLAGKIANLTRSPSTAGNGVVIASPVDFPRRETHIYLFIFIQGQPNPLKQLISCALPLHRSARHRRCARAPPMISAEISRKRAALQTALRIAGASEAIVLERRCPKQVAAAGRISGPCRARGTPSIMCPTGS